MLFVVRKRDEQSSLFLWDCPVLNRVDTFSTGFKENVMKQYVKRTQRDYSLSFKLAVVEQV
jgi:hypothetical protein